MDLKKALTFTLEKNHRLQTSHIKSMEINAYALSSLERRQNRNYEKS